MDLNNIPGAGVAARRTEGMLSAAGQLPNATPIQSPQRLRRALTVKETDEIKALLAFLQRHGTMFSDQITGDDAEEAYNMALEHGADLREGSG